jgi:hypothetical protein
MWFARPVLAAGLVFGAGARQLRPRTCTAARDARREAESNVNTNTNTN